MKYGDSTDSETNIVWEVSCSCGFEEYIEDGRVAHEVFESHSENFQNSKCTSVSVTATIVYEGEEIDPEKTLPQARP
jgi:hypothetical protein